MASNGRPQSRSISPPPTKRQRTSNSIQSPHDSEKDKSLTVYSWNVNGISPFLQPSITSFFAATKQSNTNNSGGQIPKVSLRGFLKRHRWPQLLYLQEVKINPDDSSTIQAVKQAVKRSSNEADDAPDYEAHFCLPSDAHNARGFGRKVYGVCSIIREDFAKTFVHRIRPVDWDREGRVLVVETSASGGPGLPKLAIINVYAVNGTNNPYKDSTTGEVVGTRHERKLEFHKSLQAEVRMLENEGFGVIIAGDINIARTQMDGHPNLRTFPEQHCINRADFEKRFFESQEKSDADVDDVERDADCLRLMSKRVERLGMIDTFRELHPAREGYTYYPRTKDFGSSCDRVDMVLASRKLEPYLREAGMHETPSERGPSDHVPLFAKFDFASARGKSRASDGSGS